MIYTIGESLLDIVFKNNAPQFSRAGGSQLNSSVSLGRLGCDVEFITELGMDTVGDQIIQFLIENKVGVKYLSRFSEGHTALALAFLNEKNDASYQFYKIYPEKRLQIELPVLEKSDLLLFGSIYSLTESIRPTMLELLKRAQQAEVLCIYDPNVRAHCFAENKNARNYAAENVQYATVIRASDEDCRLLYDAQSGKEAFEKISGLGCNILVYTKGAAGVEVHVPDILLNYDAQKIQPVSTIGAGDTFNASLLAGITKNGFNKNDLLKGREVWDVLIPQCVRHASGVCRSTENYVCTE